MADLSTFQGAVEALTSAGLSKAFIAAELGVEPGTLSRMLRTPSAEQKAQRNYTHPPRDWQTRLSVVARAGAARVRKDADKAAASLLGLADELGG